MWAHFFCFVFLQPGKASVRVFAALTFRRMRRAPVTWGGQPRHGANTFAHTPRWESVWLRTPMDASNCGIYCVISAARHRWPESPARAGEVVTTRQVRVVVSRDTWQGWQVQAECVMLHSIHMGKTSFLLENRAAARIFFIFYFFFALGSWVQV